MGIHRQMPDALRRLHPKYRTPWIGILVFSVLAILILLPGQETFIGSIYSFGALLSFTIAHVSVARLRAKYPDFPRPYRGPWNLQDRRLRRAAVRARSAAASPASRSWSSRSSTRPSAAVGAGWIALGMVVYLVFRRRHGLDLTSTHKVAIPQPVVDHEAEYDSVLVPVSDGYDEHVMATATKLAARKRRGIHVVAFVTVPYALPIEARMDEEESAAQSVIEQARVQSGSRVSGHTERIRPGQAGRRIVEEAIDMRAAAIVLALPRRVDGASLFGKTLETVLAERPCRVVIESTPPPKNEVRRRTELAKAGTAVRALTRLTSGLLVFLGLAIIVRTIDAGGGALAFGILVGVLFIAAGGRAAVPVARAAGARVKSPRRRHRAAEPQARARLAGPVRDRPGLRRRLDLLRRRRRGGQGARAHLAGVPGRRRSSSR